MQGWSLFFVRNILAVPRDHNQLYFNVGNRSEICEMKHADCSISCTETAYSLAHSSQRYFLWCKREAVLSTSRLMWWNSVFRLYTQHLCRQKTFHVPIFFFILAHFLLTESTMRLKNIIRYTEYDAPTETLKLMPLFAQICVSHECIRLQILSFRLI